MTRVFFKGVEETPAGQEQTQLDESPRRRSPSPTLKVARRSRDG